MRIASALVAALAAFTLAGPAPAAAQDGPTQDPVIQQMWQVGMWESQVRELAQVLMDSIGPRVAGSPNLAAAQDWLLGLYESWDIPARREQYGTWTGWREGILHVDMISPWTRTLNARPAAYSPTTDGPVEGDVVALPMIAMDADSTEWLPQVAGKWVLVMPPEPMCRGEHELEEYARAETVERVKARREEISGVFRQLVRNSGGFQIIGRMEEAGALGLIVSQRQSGWGTYTVFSSWTRQVPQVFLSCEDYGMLFRMAARDQGPRLRIDAQGEDLGEVPQFNVIAELRGTELPDEYVLLGAHLDSWHGGTGATDNGTGTIMMLEAMRILKRVYPEPRRTVLVGHWGAEEVGLIGSSAFREDHPEVMEGMQAAFNQDNGTWRIIELEGQGFADAENHLPQWVAALPAEISSHVEVITPGGQESGGSDHTSFICADVPSFRLRSPYPEYRAYTWHTNLDTYDKIVFDDLKENATMAAMLAYKASEDPVRFGRERAELPVSERTGEPREWLNCFEPRRAPR
jgi:hypothetical protein